MNDKLDLTPLRNAIISLREAAAVVSDSAWVTAQALAVQNTLTAGVIQNFEFVYELSIKMMRRELEKDADSVSSTDFSGFRELLRSAAEKGLITDVEAWFDYRKMRDITAHTYDHDKAQQVLAATPGFIEGAYALQQVLDARNV